MIEKIVFTATILKHLYAEFDEYSLISISYDFSIDSKIHKDRRKIMDIKKYIRWGFLSGMD